MRLCIIVFFFLFFRNEAFDHELVLDYYKESCPHAEKIVREQVEIVVFKDPRTAAFLLRLHFHDCFVLGCDASILLDDGIGIVSEKQALPNLNSIRGFDVIDRIKEHLEATCPTTVSCADILAIAARDAVYLRGGPSWEVELGRRDSLKASLSDANLSIPPPNSTLEMLVSSFLKQGLDIRDLVTLSGGHTIGKTRCLNVRQRIYGTAAAEEGDHYERSTIFRRVLRSVCPSSGRDDRVVPLDVATPARFDNLYFRDVIEGKGILESDDALVSEGRGVDDVARMVYDYAHDQRRFFREFAKSMVRMGRIGVVGADLGQVRRNCRFLNSL